ncbi:hypothetical protein Salat_2919500 [Sesamum alatum]|uniref:Uncharacterized protein n=1 Tax=Sesamum alatum TaxID=300844 RepID=A0AAE1XJS1_9LAMI|nr:hypothetical protein Salat_2919500 [Sesamum alatum]
MYAKAGGKGTNVVIYYALPNETLDMSLRILEGDEGIRELLRDYRDCNVISLYFEDKAGPLLSVDIDGNILHNVDPVPQLEYITEMEADTIDETGADWGEFVGEVHGGTEGVVHNNNEGVDETEEVVENDSEGLGWIEGAVQNDSEGVAGTEGGRNSLSNDGLRRRKFPFSVVTADAAT